MMDITGLGMGTWNMGEDPQKKKDEIAAIRYGLDNGISIIDTAEMYGEGKSESLIGQALEGYDRTKVYLISKFYPYHATPELERKSLEASLKRLKTDYLDLYLLHWRGSHRLSDTIRGLEELKKEGLIKNWGVSNFDTDDMKELFSLPDGKSVLLMKICIIWIIVVWSMIYYHGKRKNMLTLLDIHHLIQAKVIASGLLTI